MTRIVTLGRTTFLSPAERLLHGRSLLDAIGDGGAEEWLRLSRQVGSDTDRRWRVSGRIRVGFHWFDMHEPADWRTAPAPGPDGVIAFSTGPPGEAELCLALCHAEDRVREDALTYAADRPEVLPLVLIRCADHVEAVRERARALLAAAPAEAVRPLADLALLVGAQRHGQWGWQLVVDRLGGVPAERIEWLTGHSDDDVRRAALRTAVRYGLLPDWRAELLAADDPEAGFRRIAVLSGMLCADTLEHLAATDPEADVRRPALDLLLRQPFADVLPRLLRLAGTSGDKVLRRRALDAVRSYAAGTPLPSPEALLASPALAVRLLGAEELLRAGRYAELEPLLTDRAAKLRAVGRRALRAAGGDPRAYYRELCAAAPTKWAVLGLTECADPADTALLWRLAGQADGKVGAAALAGLRRRRAVEPEQLLPLLADPHPGVAKAVRNAALEYGDALPEAGLAALLAPEQPRAEGRAALLLLDRRTLVVRRRVARTLGRHRDPAVRAWARGQLGRPLHWSVSTGRDTARALLKGAAPEEVVEVEDPAAWLALDLGTRSFHRSLDADLRAVPATALCHPSGRVRQKALPAAARDSRLWPLLVLRCADWAPPVREAARALLAEVLRTDPPAALGALTPVVLRLARGERGCWAAARFEVALRSPAAADALPGLLASPDRATRRLAARTMLESGRADALDLALRAAAEPDAVVRRMWTDGALALLAARGTDDSAVEALLGARAGYVRAAGVTALRAAGRAGEASGYLTDRSAQVRACARWLLRQDGGDARAAYRALAAGDPAPLAVVGLAECGQRADAPVLARLLATHPDDRVRAAAVTGLALLNATPALMPLLDDPSPAVARAARRALYGRTGPLTVAELRERCAAGRAPHTRREALRLLAGHGGAEGVCTAVGLLGDPDPELRAVARRIVRAWDWSEALELYPEVLPELRELLSRHQADIDAGELWRIRKALRAV